MNYELLCEVLLEVLQEYRTQLQKLQSENKELQKKIDAEKIFNAYYTELQHERDQFLRNNKELQRDYEQLQSEKTNLLLHRNSLQAENNKLILERDELKTDLKEQIDAGMWLKHECDKIRKERDQLRDDTARLARNWDDCENKLKELQSKNNELKRILKDRGVIVIDDSIVREEPK